MESQKISNADCTRIAIAFAALKFKPAHQSYTSYVLDLLTKFTPPVPSAPTTDGSWRTYALNLEQEYAALQEKYEAEQIKSFAVRSRKASTINSEQASSTAPVTAVDVAADGKKKKTKKKVVPTLPPTPATKAPEIFVHSDLQPIVEELENRRDIPTLIGDKRASFLSSLNTFLLLTSPPKTTNINKPLLLSATLRVIDAISQPLRAILGSFKSATSQINLLKTFGIIFNHVFSIAIPMILPKHSKTSQISYNYEDYTPLETLLAHILKSILTPAMQSFLPLSNIAIQGILSTPPTKEPSQEDATCQFLLDPRPDVLAFFRIIVCCLFESTSLYLSRHFSPLETNGNERSLNITPLKKITLKMDSLRAAMVLETIREVDRLLFPEGDASNGNSCGPLGSLPESAKNPLLAKIRRIGVPNGWDQYEYRTKRLAAKGALWYLCTILHILCGRRLDQRSTTWPIYTSGEPASATEGSQMSVPCDHDVLQTGEEKAVQLLNKSILDSLFALIIKCNYGKALHEQRGDDDSATNQSSTAFTRDAPRQDHAESDIVGNKSMARDKELEPDKGKFSKDANKSDGINPPSAANSPPDNIGHSQSNLKVFNNVQGSAAGMHHEPYNARSCRGGSDGEGVSHASGMIETSPEGRSDKERASFIDETGYNMLLGVVERFVEGLEFCSPMGVPVVS